VQEVLTGHNRPKYFKREIAFRGLRNTDRTPDAQRVFELVNNVYLLQFSQDSAEKVNYSE
jgi:hypothetical protein